MAGTLFLVGTPIGNLEDMTIRGVRILKEADLIAAEDTRTSRRLLDEYGIETPLTSLHKFNETGKSGFLLEKLLAGANIALITDAGMPAISDPGEILVRKCVENHVNVTAVPGPSACVTALALSGIDSRRFVFEGFLPADSGGRREVLRTIRDEKRTMIFYEAPHRLARTLAQLIEVLGEDRELALARELTKRFEEVTHTTLGEALAEAGEKEPRGEYVLVIGGAGEEVLAEHRAEKYRGMDIPSHVRMFEEQGMSRKDAMKACAAERGLSRRDVYAALLEAEK